MNPRPAKLFVLAQGVIAMVALVALTMWPPTVGRMLLIPVGAGDANAAAKVALAGGARLLGAGPLPGSLVVIGDRPSIARRIRSWDMLIVSAPPAGCGDGDGGRA